MDGIHSCIFIHADEKTYWKMASACDGWWRRRALMHIGRI